MLSALQVIQNFVTNIKAAAGHVPAENFGGQTYVYFNTVLNDELIPLSKAEGLEAAEEAARGAIENYLALDDIPPEEGHLRAEFEIGRQPDVGSPDNAL